MGELGVAEGGAVYLQVSPFWHWDSPQTVRANGPGYTVVTASADDITLQTESPLQQLLKVTNVGRALVAGDRITFDYGAGPMGARADMYAEKASRFWIAVDGDGDGVRKVLADSPSVRVRAGAPARCVATIPSRAKPGEKCELTLAVLDRYANFGVEFEGSVTLSGAAEVLGLPDVVAFEADSAGLATLSFTAPGEGTYRLTARVELPDSTFTTTSNPLVVSTDFEPLYWADLHGHSSYSDGTGTPDEYLSYARDVAALDVIALTDHDHYGVRFLDASEERWTEIQDLTKAFHVPGEFVTLLGYEWTNWIYGHRHVLYFEDHGHVHSSVSEEADTPRELWALLRDQPAMTITHHSAGSPVANDWSIPPDPVLEPVAEIASVHGTSEAADAPTRLRGFLPDHSVRSALGRGYRLGFIGSGDSHDGHPGLPHLSPSYGYRPGSERGPERMGTGGLAAVHAEELTRESILQALRDRRVYATSGPRIVLTTSLAGATGGAVLKAGEVAANPTLEFELHGTAGIEVIELVRDQHVVRRLDALGNMDLAGQFEIASPAPTGFVYLRIRQVDGGLAWSSPYFFE